MSDPVRIREAGSDAPEELRDLFRSAVKPAPPSPAVGAMLSSRIAGLAAAPAAPPVLAKVLVGLLGGTLALGGVVGYRVRHVEPATPAVGAPTPVRAPSPVRASTPALIPPAVPPPPPATAAPARAAPPRLSAAPGAGDDGLAGEERVLNEAHEALASSPRRALALARGHARRYPRGQLFAERELIEIEALVKLGRHREAEALARVLRETAPNNIYEDRLDELLRER
ncbi:MAG TPA: hypothetical protein VHL80_13070 [Polyangia bacterium]|nr:hypothetical protein [Polyangia bacterium]